MPPRLSLLTSRPFTSPFRSAKYTNFMSSVFRFNVASTATTVWSMGTISSCAPSPEKMQQQQRQQQRRMKSSGVEWRESLIAEKKLNARVGQETAEGEKVVAVDQDQLLHVAKILDKAGYGKEGPEFEQGTLVEDVGLPLCLFFYPFYFSFIL